MSRLFPELESEPDQATTARPSRGGLRGGAAARPEAIARLAVMIGAPGRVRSAAVTTSGDVHVEIDLGKAGVARVAFVEDLDRVWLRGERFGVTHQDARVHPALAEILRRFLQRAAATPLSAIRAILAPEPEDAHRISWDDPTSLVLSYGAARAWRSFFEERELYRGVCESFQGNVVVVMHNELECQYNSVSRARGATSFFNAVSTTAESATHVRELNTDLQDLDVIKGGDAKLDAALEAVARSGARPDMVVVKSTCVPIVTGDDMEAAAGRAQRKLGLPVIVAGNHNNPMEATIARALSDKAITSVPPRRGAVNLLGMPHIPGYDAFVAMLESAGIVVNCALFPEVGMEALARFGAAELAVIYDWERHASGAAMLARHFDMKVIAPPQPFGMEGSRRWLFAIADALGKHDDMARVWEACAAPLSSTWQSLKDAARAYRLGFVVEDDRWEETLAARRCMGVPLLDVLGEMGFELDVFVHTAEAVASSAGKERAHVSLHAYQTRADLEARLRSARSVAIYSEMYFDRRLTRTGKNAFSLKDFHLGPEGAIATIRRLLAVCRLPFFRTYARYLGRPFSTTGTT